MRNESASDCQTQRYVKFRLSAHPIISVFLLHGVWVEESDDGAGLSFPVFFVNFTKQQQRDEDFQVMEVVEFPDAKGLALQRRKCCIRRITASKAF